MLLETDTQWLIFLSSVTAISSFCLVRGRVFVKMNKLCKYDAGLQLESQAYQKSARALQFNNG